MWPGGQVWKSGPTYPATVAAWPPVLWFRIRVFCSRGSLTPDFMIGPRPHPSNPRHDHPIGPQCPSPPDVARAPLWERRRPRRHLLNGCRPHPSNPRHDHPIGPSGAGVQHRPTRRRRSRGGADPGRLTVRLSERFFGLRISGFAAIVLKNERLSFASSSTRSQALLSTLG